MGRNGGGRGRDGLRSQHEDNYEWIRLRGSHRTSMAFLLLLLNMSGVIATLCLA